MKRLKADQDVMRGESRRARPLTATAGARARCPWSRRPQRRVLRPPLLPRLVLAPPAFPSGCAVPWRFLKARRRPHGVLVAAARAARAPLLDDLVDGDLARIRGYCTSNQKEPKHLFAFGSVITAELASFVGLPAQPAGGPCVSWYRGILYGRTPTYGFTRGRTSLCRSLRGPPRQRGRLPAGPTGGPACPAYILYLTCRLPKVDLSVTEVVYTTKVVYLPVLINPGSQFDS